MSPERLTMTTATQSAIASSATPAARKDNGASIVATVAGAVLAAIGIGLAILGGSLAAVFGSDNTVGSGTHSLSTSRAALVTPVDDIDGMSDISDVIGETHVRLSATATGSADGLFVGVGPAAQVDRYLAGVSTDEVTDFDVDPFKMTRQPHDGMTRAAPPASQSFWVAQGSGRDATAVNWKVKDGDYRVVLMNTDGSGGVDADGNVALTLPHVGSIAWILIAGGSLMAIGGGAAIVVSTRRRRSA
jgi:hypothetical protein